MILYKLCKQVLSLYNRIYCNSFQRLLLVTWKRLASLNYDVTEQQISAIR